ncbi:MAG: isoprenylcysteine carboxylmethyltransferase family protein [Thermoanaerobaculia bacterium]|nr:isoprenylcysteine carboxylmethyltransferase family protein [Thermoanaerobaculia bacterium]
MESVAPDGLSISLGITRTTCLWGQRSRANPTGRITVSPDVSPAPQADDPSEVSSRWLGFAFALVVYLVGVRTLLYLVGFLCNKFVPKGIDQGPVGGGAISIAIDLALLLSFFVVHSLMVRPVIKVRILRILHPSLERSVYVLVASLHLMLLFWFWNPLPVEVWSFDSILARRLVWSLNIAAWLIALIAIKTLQHTRLFGLRPAWRRLRRQPPDSDPMVATYLHARVRHPMYLGFLLGVWTSPDMTRGHLLFAASCSLYILIGIHFEERELVRKYGDSYRLYRRRVGGLVPRRLRLGGPSSGED